MNGSAQQLCGRRTRPLLSAVGAGVVIGVAALAIAFDWNWFKGPIERYVSGITGRSFAIGDDLAVDLGSVIRIDAKQVILGNASWASSPHLARADRVRLNVELWPLLAGRWVVPRIELWSPAVDLERNAGGEANWRLREPSEEPSKSNRGTALEELVIHQGILRLREPRLRTDLRLQFDTEPRGPDGASPPIVAKGTGRYRNGQFQLSARLDSPLQLLEDGREDDRAYRVEASARA